MIRVSGISLPLEYTDDMLKERVAYELKLDICDIKCVYMVKRSVDARKKKDVKFNLAADVTVYGDEREIVNRCGSLNVRIQEGSPYVFVKCTRKFKRRPVVVGCGPAGLFAALTLAQAGLEPVLLERGGDVAARTKDVEDFRMSGVLNVHSNVQFGEGGAGTFSDGKLNTGIKDVRCRFILEQLAKACDDHSLDHILWQAKPHIGTDKLRQAVVGLRTRICDLGGEVRFNSQVVDLVVENENLKGIVVCGESGEYDLETDRAIFAIGHSARDTMEMLFNRGASMSQKPFAVGVRIEHPRRMIDESQYGHFAGHPRLGAAEYKLSCKPDGKRGVYTFCMCPGGVVIAASSEEGGVVVNGMSEFSRSAVNSNSALLVGVGPKDYGSDHPLAGIVFQRDLERRAFEVGGGNYRAPVQLVGDFLRNRPSESLGDVFPSYLPGFSLSELDNCLPSFVVDSLRSGLPMLARQLSGFDRYDAVMTGIESRSSSPVRIFRDDLGESTIKGVYPCGEGAGYAGGIVSAAVDGMRCAEWMIRSL